MLFVIFFFIAFYIADSCVRFFFNRLKFPDFNFYDWFESDLKEGCEKKYENE